MVGRKVEDVDKLLKVLKYATLLYGIGYINRQGGEEIYGNLRRQGYRPISEQDIHHMFIESIIAGRPTSTHGLELITGLQRFSPLNKQPLHWHFNPKFSHHVTELDHSLIAEATASTESVKQQLRATSSVEEAGETLKRCFSARLELMLQAAPESISRDVPIIELGVDSLVEVEIRSWFLKEVEKDMPVLKVLGGSTIAELCEELAVEIAADNAIPAVVTPETGFDSEILAESSLASQTMTATDGSAATPLTAYSENSEDDELLELSDKLNAAATQMSYGQARLWFPYLYLEDKTAYNCTTSYRLKGLLDVSRFESALHATIQRHQVLRMSFYTDFSSRKAMQAISPTSPFELKKVSPANLDEDVRRETEKIAKHIYDLEAADVFIATVLAHGQGMHTVVFGYHHIMIDAVSWQFFLQDLERFYSADDPMLGPASKYTDFAIKQRRLMESGGAQEKRKYWMSEFADLPPALPLFPFSTRNARKSLLRYDVREYFILLDPTLVMNIKKASTSAKTTTFHFYLSVLQVLLLRFLDIDDMCIGITDSNRTDPAFMQTVGFLLDSLPLRFKIKRGEPFLERIQSTRSKVYAALGNSGVPLEVILEDLNATTSAATLPLFQILVNYRMGALKQKTMGGVQFDFLAYEDAKHPYDFILSVDEDEGAGGLTLSMQEYLYDQTGGDLFLKTYAHLLEVFSSDITQCLDGCPLFHDNQKQSAIALSTAPKLSHDWPETLSLRVDHVVERYPNELPVKDPSGVSVTYRQLAERSNAVALELQAAGAGSSSHVALFCEPCTDAISSLLAILRIGAVYVPLDVRNSDERLSAIVEESKAGFVICHSMTRDRIGNLGLLHSKVMDISTVGAKATKIVPNQSTGPSKAFIMWTSGSTGKPKGIVLTHTNFLTHVIAATQRMGIERERILQQSALGYDASLAQIFHALANGGTLIMSSNRQEMSQITALVLREEITFTLCAPSEYTAMFRFGGSILNRCKSWRIAMCGGEAFPPHLIARFLDLKSPHLEVFNAYGPTEISVASNIGRVDHRHDQQRTSDSRVPIGSAIPDYAIYILDDESSPVPMGWVGGICVAGPAVATGYMGMEALTKLKFIPDQISQQVNATGWGTIYRTGDRGRMLPEGFIEYHGRIDGDSQVKLRGIRIELNDITSTILLNSGGIVVDDAVIVKEYGGEKLLVAYVVFEPDRTPEQPERYLKRLLLELPLPVYMRPAVAVQVKRLPLNASGKLDIKLLKALPLPHVSETDEDSAKLTEAESDLKSVWEDILPLTGLAITKSSDFFSVGGNSLLLLELQVEMRKIFDKNISLQELFQASTLASLALKVQKDGASLSTSLAKNPTSAVPVIDWKTETSLPADLFTSLTPSKPRLGRRGPLIIVLTGATGFLGRSLLRALETSEQILHVHCIAVRPKNSNTTRSLAHNFYKVTYHAGDLSLPRLGLGEDEARLVFEDADAIVHNGADVSFMQTYQSLRGPNVESTKELVRCTAHRCIPFHYISTAGVVHLTNQDFVGEVSFADYPPPADGSDDYIASKWASECVLEKVHKEIAMPVTIYRPSSITGEGAPRMDVMQNVLRFSREMHAVPDLTGWKGFFDFIDVERVARGVVNHISRSGRLMAQQNIVDYIHSSGQTVVPVEEVKEYLERETGNVFRIVEMNKWIVEARTLWLDQLVGMYLGTVAESGTLLPRLGTRWH